MDGPWYEIEHSPDRGAPIEVTLSPLSGKGFALGHPPPDNGYMFRMTVAECLGFAYDLAASAGHPRSQPIPPPSRSDRGLAKRVADLERALYGETREP